MTDTTQMGFPNPDGSITWKEPEPTTLDSRTNLFKRWRAAGTLDFKDIVLIPGGIEIAAYPHDSELKGVRQRLDWAEELERLANSPVGRCEHCQGRSNPDCPEHGIGASLKRENDFWASRGGCSGNEGSTA